MSSEKIIQASHDGDLPLGNTVIPCAVLPGGTRVLSRIGFIQAIGRKGKAKGGRKYDQESQVPVFLTAHNLKPFVSNELIENSKSVPYIPVNGGLARMGYKAELLPQVCYVFIDALEAGVLRGNQLHIAEQCKILVRGFAVVGITALVDEATGYQEVRDRLALREILDKYLRKEFAAWAKRFPDEFYMEMFRLRNWQWKGMKVNRPSVVGHYTKDLVYERLLPDLLVELEKLNPKEGGRRKHKHHQLFTDEVGHPALAQHLYAVIGLMRASSTWEHFYRMMQRAFPKKNTTMLLPGIDIEPPGPV